MNTKINENNILLDTDSYKYSHPGQLPPDSEAASFYIEARKNNLGFQQSPKGVLFNGLQPILHRLSTAFTAQDIDEAESLIMPHMGLFPRKSFEYILNTYGGIFPVKIYAPREGLVIPFGNALTRVDVEDPQAISAVGFLETMLMRVWYPGTVGTISKFCKDIIWEYLEKSCETPAEQIDFKLHDFGSRGVSSRESAGIGGMAHLINFKGTDTVAALVHARNYYDADVAGFSIPAAEHSTITSWGRAFEREAYANMVDLFGKKDALFAVVSDSYDLKHAVSHIWGEELKQKVVDSGAILVIRPDSGDPITQVLQTANILAEKYGYTTNKLGYKVLNGVRIIQGDGIDPVMIRRILIALVEINHYSAENVAFGMGGALLQRCDRDTFSFAMKMSAIKRAGVWQDVYKDPVAGGKTSKRGILELVYDRTTANKMFNHYKTVKQDEVTASQSKLFRCVFDGTHGNRDGLGPRRRTQNLMDLRINSMLTEPDYFVA